MLDVMEVYVSHCSWVLAGRVSEMQVVPSDLTFAYPSTECHLELSLLAEGRLADGAGGRHPLHAVCVRCVRLAPVRLLEAFNWGLQARQGMVGILPEVTLDG